MIGTHSNGVHIISEQRSLVRYTRAYNSNAVAARIDFIEVVPEGMRTYLTVTVPPFTEMQLPPYDACLALTTTVTLDTPGPVPMRATLDLARHWSTETNNGISYDPHVIALHQLADEVIRLNAAITNALKE